MVSPHNALRILCVEDDAADFLLLELHLRKADVAAMCRRVATGAELEAALREPWDVVLLDYHVSGMDCRTTLHRLRGGHPEVPVIAVAGHIGEETAMELLHLGLSDFVLKDNLVRLTSAICRALDAAEGGRAQQQAERALRESEQRLRLAIQAGNVGLWDWDLRTNQVRYSREWKSQIGYAEDEITDSFEEWRSRVHAHPPQAMCPIQPSRSVAQGWRRRPGSGLHALDRPSRGDSRLPRPCQRPVRV